ncbi:hypothetical protein [Microcoleus sp. FACHB-SPT15]|nr:hypothetical protein [Microcoleus sp. FACHB-SPT15]
MRSVEVKRDLRFAAALRYRTFPTLQRQKSAIAFSSKLLRS